MIQIKNIVNEYYELIDNFFKSENREISETSEEKYATVIESIIFSSPKIDSISFKTELDKKFEDFICELSSYWERNENAIMEFVNNSQLNTVAIWADEPIPELTPKFLLYYDAVLIPDPIMNLGRSVLEGKNYRDAFTYFLILNEIRSLQSTNTDTPLFIIFPYKKGFLGNETLNLNSNVAFEFLNSPAGKIAHDAFNRLTNLNLVFKDDNELLEKLNQLSIKQLNSNLNLPLITKFLSFVINNPNFLQASSRSGKLDFIISNRLNLKQMNSLDLWSLFSVISSMYAVFEVREYNALKLNTTNMVTSTHLPFAEFKYQEITNSFGSILEIPEEQLINYSINQNFNWLNHIDIQIIKELRENSKLETYREILRNQSQKIKNISFDKFPELSLEFEKQVFKELQEEQNNIEKEISEIKRKRLITTGSFSVTAGLTFSSLAFPALLPLTIASTAFGIAGGASIKDIVSDVIYGNGKLKELQKRPISVILKK